MKKLIFPLIGLTFATACQKEAFIPKPTPGEEVNYTDHPRHEVYLSQLEHYQKETHAPGAILLVQRAGEPIWVGAVGRSNLEHQSPMRTNSQFRIGSITKLFTATVVMQLAEQEKLQLDAPVTKWLPKLQGQIPGAEQISIRHLLAHQSGIFDPTNESTRYKLDLVDAPEKIAAMDIDGLLEVYVYGKALHFAPGSNYAYSNVNYWLLGQIVSSVTGKSLQAVLEELIFSPLSLQHTYLEKRDDRNVARGYADVYGDGTLLDVTHWERAEVDGNAAGGIISTVVDLKVFMQALMQGQIVTMASLEEMKKVQLLNCDDPECESGLGLELWRTGAGIGYGKNGSIAGTEANVVYYPESGNMFVLYKNNGNGSDKSFLDQIME
jgi:D-alanyl-D-alanine carboxypeptidase